MAGGLADMNRVPSGPRRDMEVQFPVCSRGMYTRVCTCVRGGALGTLCSGDTIRPGGERRQGQQVSCVEHEWQWGWDAEVGAKSQAEAREAQLRNLGLNVRCVERL